MSQKNKRNKAIYLIVVGLYMIWFFFFLGDNGPYLMRDSYAFIEGRHIGVAQYGLYIAFIKLCRLIFGQRIYLYAIFVIQSVLAAISSVITVEYLRRLYGYNYIKGMVLYILSSLPYTYSLPENVVSHHILTEGLSIPLFYLFFLFALKILFEDEKKVFKAICLILVAIMEVFTRPHLILLLPMALFIIVVALYRRTKRNRCSLVRTAKASFVIIFIILCVSPALIQFMVRMSAPGSQTVDALTGRIFCLSEEDDVNHMDEGIRELFVLVHDYESKEGHLRASYGHTDRYVDDIVYHTNEINKNLINVIKQNYEVYSAYHENNALTPTSIRKVLLYDIIRQHKTCFLIDTLALIEKSMVASVFVQPDSIYILCHIVAIMLHIISALMFVYGLCNNKVDEIYLWPFLVAYILLLSNVVSTNLIMFGIQRYVIYTQGLFYITLFIMATGIRKAIHER